MGSMPYRDARHKGPIMAFGGTKPSWQIDGQDWPNHDASQFLSAGGLRWHVQISGTGPDLLLLHGTGAATHSWRHLLPLLAAEFRVIAPDLPGHGFTASPPRRQLTLPGMAAALRALLAALDAKPAYVAGHSAGAAILADMCLTQALQPKLVISINGALLPFHGKNQPLFSFLAKALALNPLAPRLFAWQNGNLPAVTRLMTQVGSKLDPQGLDYYRRLLARSGHVAAALNMMANWQLDALTARLPELTLPVLLIAGARDGAVPPAQARRLQALLPHAELVILEEVGHLAHEERPQEVAALIVQAAHRAATPAV